MFGDNSVFKQAVKAKEETEIAKAREKLEIVLSSAQVPKRTNPSYNKNEFLDEYIMQKIEDAKISDDIIIVDEYAFELDRSVPKIGEYIGKKEELAFPEINISEPNLSEDLKNATFTFTAIESKNGIERIEIIQNGQVMESYEYDNRKDEVKETYIAKQNGNYTVKVYSKFNARDIVKVEGIKSILKLEPNGNSEWKKEHSTKVTLLETNDKVIKAKYQWIDSVEEPDDEQFKNEFESKDVIAKEGLIGTNYLWTMLEMQSGEKIKWRSEGFNFDNEGPDVTSLTSTPLSYSSFKLEVTAIDKHSGIVKYEFFVNGVSKGIKTRKDITAQTLLDTTGPDITNFTATKYSETGITLSATAQDAGRGIVKFEFYIDGVIKSNYTQTMTETTSSVTKTVNITGLTTGSHTCAVKVYDAENNSNSKTVSSSTKLYTWEVYNVITKTEYELVKTNTKFWGGTVGNSQYKVVSNFAFNSTTGKISYKVGSKASESYRGYVDLLYTPGTITNNETVILKVNRVEIDGIMADWYLDVYASTEKQVLTKGDNKENALATSTGRNTYPDNGAKNNKWYVYKGVQ